MTSFFIDFAGEYGCRYKVYELDTETQELVREITEKGFPTEKQIRFFDSTFLYLLFGGARGGGKTEAIIWGSIFKAYLVPGSRQIIFRRTMGELEKTIIDRYKELPEGLVGVYRGTQSSEHMEFPNGSKVYFASAKNEEDVSKYLSGEFLCIYFDEWSEWLFGMWKRIAGSCRSKVDKDVFGNEILAQIKGCTNPGGVGGDELASLFGCGRSKRQVTGEDKADYKPEEYDFIFSTVDDNPAYAAGTPAGDAYRRMLDSMPRRIKAAWRDGRWDGFEGMYFEEYNEEHSVIHHDDFLRLAQKQQWQPIWISIDWGSTHHFYVCWHTYVTFILPNQDQIDVQVTFREWLAKGLGEVAMSDEIVNRTPLQERKRVTNVYLSPDCGFEDENMRGYRIGSVFVGNEMPRAEAAFSSRTDGWSLMNDLLRAEVDLSGVGDPKDRTYISKWLLTTNCPSAMEAIPQADCDPKTDGDIKKEGSSPVLDVLDGLRYGVASHTKPEAKPFSEKVKDEIITLPKSGNSRYIRMLQMQADERVATEPFYTTPAMAYRKRR